MDSLQKRSAPPDEPGYYYYSDPNDRVPFRIIGVSKLIPDIPDMVMELNLLEILYSEDELKRQNELQAGLIFTMAPHRKIPVHKLTGDWYGPLPQPDTEWPTPNSTAETPTPS